MSDWAYESHLDPTIAVHEKGHEITVLIEQEWVANEKQQLDLS